MIIARIHAIYHLMKLNKILMIVLASTAIGQTAAIADMEALKKISKSGFSGGTNQEYDIIRTAIKRSAEFN
ncbi:MAG: hypothetical protein JKX71_09330 [Amylibacter sp.]|nr:hypothetical protein [Amylibacter sp.]